MRRQQLQRLQQQLHVVLIPIVRQVKHVTTVLVQRQQLLRRQPRQPLSSTTCNSDSDCASGQTCQSGSCATSTTPPVTTDTTVASTTGANSDYVAIQYTTPAPQISTVSTDTGEQVAVSSTASVLGPTSGPAVTSSVPAVIVVTAPTSENPQTPNSNDQNNTVTTTSAITPAPATTTSSSTTCNSDSDCASGQTCDSGSCVDSTPAASAPTDNTSTTVTPPVTPAPTDNSQASNSLPAQTSNDQNATVATPASTPDNSTVTDNPTPTSGVSTADASASLFSVFSSFTHNFSASIYNAVNSVSHFLSADLSAAISPVPAPILTKINIIPISSSLTVDGATQQLTAATLDQNGNPITAPINWISNNTAVATVDSNGMVTPVGAGTADITASNEAAPLVNVLASAKIPKIFKVGQEDKIQIKWKNNGNQDVTFNAYDTDNDGYLDYVEWTVPHLSDQVFDIIFISKAFQLNNRQNITNDIYSQVQVQDNCTDPRM